MPHTSTKLPTVFTLLGAIFYAYLVDKGMSEIHIPESEKEQLAPAGYSDWAFPFLTYPRYAWTR